MEVIPVFLVLKTIIMAAEGGGVIVRFLYTGAEGEIIPREAGNSYYYCLRLFIRPCTGILSAT